MKAKDTFYKTFFSLYTALVLQNVITLSVNLADNIMLGAFSETALAGAAAVNQIQFVYQQLLMGLADGVVIFGSQYWGQKRTEPIKRISSVAMHAGMILAILLFVVVSMFPEKVVGLFTTDVQIIEAGVAYLKLIRFTYLFFAATQILLATLRSTETVKIAFYLSVMTLIVNCSINYVLISGHFGCPQMGIQGAAVGTLTARCMEFSVLVGFIWKKEKYLHLQVKEYLHTDHEMSRAYFHVALPMIVTQGLWGVNTALQTVVLGHMTSTAIAANSAASTLFLLIKSIAVGAAAAAAVLMGKTVGSGDMKLVRVYAKRLQVMFFVIGVCSAILLFFLRIPFLAMYDLRPETMRMTNTFLLIFCIVVLGMSYQMATNNGIIKGGGDALFVVRLDLISIWLIVLPVSFFVAFVVKASPVVVFCCLNADQVFKCVPAFIKANYGHWAKRLTE